MKVSTMFEVDTIIRCLVIALLLLIRYMTLWPWPLTFWPWSVVIHGGSRTDRRTHRQGPSSWKLPLPINVGIWTSCNTWFIGPTRVLNPNGNLIFSAVFVGLTSVTD